MRDSRRGRDDRPSSSSAKRTTAEVPCGKGEEKGTIGFTLFLWLLSRLAGFCRTTVSLDVGCSGADTSTQAREIYMASRMMRDVSNPFRVVTRESVRRRGGFRVGGGSPLSVVIG